MSSFWRVSSDLEGFLADFGRLAWLRRSSRHLGSSSVILLKLIRDWVVEMTIKMAGRRIFSVMEGSWVRYLTRAKMMAYTVGLHLASGEVAVP